MRLGNVQELFDQAAQRFSSDVAISSSAGAITYGDLQGRANNLANFLISSGAPKGAIVAFMLQDPVEAITAILGILKAGCAFVSLDPELPSKRLEIMVEQVSPDWFIVESKFLALVNSLAGGAGPNARLFCVDADGLEIASSSRVLYLGGYRNHNNPEPPAIAHQPDNIAYIYFTSGSTGRPKAIAGRLMGIDHFIRWEIETLGVGPGARVSWLLPLTFDGSLRDIFVPLCAGGAICVPDSKETILDATKLIEWLNEQRINLVHCVPSLFRSIINETVTEKDFESLRHILIAGEPLLPSDVKRWMSVFGQRVSLVNLYGTSETTMAKFFYFVQAADADRQSIPIGKPMPGARALVVDEGGRICPPEVIGEILIRTPYRSLGYYNQPELTREVFIQNPFSDDPNDVVHKTGDIGRVLEDGNFEYLGRRDRQVKIRGVRVELAEVENVLRSDKAINDVAVVDQEDLSGNKFLCAYIVLSAEVDLSTLRGYAAEYLPDYMVPSAYVVMDVLPRTISGKVNRRALPSPQQAREGSGQDLVAPRTPIEEVLAAIWMRVLGLKRVSVNDSFFQLGGHSLLATQIASRIRRIFQIELPLQTLFEAPTIAGLAEKVEEALMGGGGLVAPPIKRASRGQEVPLSFAQQRLWFIDQWEPGTHAYNIDTALRLKGRPSSVALEQAINEIVRRHEALRTTFPTADGHPIQLIAPALTIDLPEVDLTGLSEPERESFARKLVKERAERAFDLALGPLGWMSLLRLSEDDRIMLFAMHHIISDAWSSGVLVREMASLYGAFSAGQPSPLPEPPIQYADFAIWQREWLQGEVLETQLAYWKKQLEGELPVLELPTDYPRPAVRSFRGATESLPLVASDSLKALCLQEGVTVFMVLLAAFQTLLSRYSGQEEVVVGSTIANRNRAEIEGLIGFFVNSLVLRADLSGNPTFRELLERVRQTTLGAYAHQDLPFQRLVEEMQSDRDLSRTPLFQVVFLLQNAPSADIKLPGVTMRSLAGEEGFSLTQDVTAKFDLTMNILEAGNNLVALLGYNTDLFGAATIRRMLAHFKRLLQAAAEDPDRPIGELRMLTEEERSVALDVWNRRGVRHPQEMCLHELFEAQVERTPDAVALTFEGEQLTYGKLNRRANQLARHLRNLGVGQDSPVGICMERGLDMVVGILATLKSGGAYVPLDPVYPQERLAFMLEDAQVKVLLTQDALLERLSGLAHTVVSVEADRAVIASQSARNPASGAAPDNLAYVIYTSGSTGKPKGVMVTHANVGRLFDAAQGWFNFNAEDVWVLFHSYAFDFSVWELWGALLYGGRLVIAPYFVSRSPETFYDLLRDEKVTVLNQTPSAFYRLMTADRAVGRVDDLALRLIIFGGEVLDLQSLGPWFERHGDERPRLVNMYGITETTVHVSYRPIASGDLTESPGSVIGGPIPDLQVYALDKHLELVPASVAGEMYIGGDGLARGYFNRPDLTAERFIPDPFSAEPGARLYSSGDLARHLPDGDLEYLGRIDQQVKIRGFRIELGEIEAALKEHGAVDQAVVIAREDSADEKRLVGYLVTEQSPAPKVDDLHSFLLRKLPEYMVPSAFVFLDSLPLTPNGKLDRRALPAPDSARPDLNQSYAPPATATEEILARILGDVLGIEHVGIHDNFFELGGHSLLATQALSKMREAFQMDFSLRNFFETPTVASLAENIDMLRWAQESTDPVGLGDRQEEGVL